MRIGVWSKKPLAALLALAVVACGGETPAADPQRTTSGDNANANPSISAPVPVEGPERRVIAFGDSLFAGYNVAPEDSYPAKLQDALRENGVNALVVNAGISGDTSAAGRQRLAFTLDAQEERPDLFILELGGNDLLRGIEPDETRANFVAMLDELRSREIPVLIMGMRAPPNYGPEYTQEFDALYGDLAREYGAAYIPFWLEEIYQEPQLFQDDRIHPTEEGIERLVAATVERVQAAIPDKMTAKE
ncbi:MAG: arylesterase [Pseudomonadota bacterium]